MNYAYNTILAINNRINDESTESAALKAAANSITLGTASEEDDYITYQLITSQHEQTFTSYIENSLIQFDIFSTSQTSCLNLMSKLEDVFDDTELSVNDYELIECTRNNSNFVGRESDTKLFHYYVEYDVNVEVDK